MATVTASRQWFPARRFRPAKRGWRRSALRIDAGAGPWVRL